MGPVHAPYYLSDWVATNNSLSIYDHPLIHSMSPIYLAGTVDLALITATGDASCSTNPFAKCFSSFSAAVASNCLVTLTPQIESGISIPAYWSALESYNQRSFCSRTTVSASAADDAAVLDTIRTLMSANLWVGKTVTTMSAANTWTTTGGVLSLSDTFDGPTCTLDWSASSSTGAGVASLIPTDCGVDSDTCKADDTSCEAGRYSLVIGSTGKYACALCAAGSTSSASAASCSSCGSGEQKSVVGSGSCSSCLVGTRSPGGFSDCIPCGRNTYADVPGADACTDCPGESVAPLPGMSSCVLCDAATVTLCNSVNDCAGLVPSDGYTVAEVTVEGDLDDTTCNATGWTTGRPDVLQCAASLFSFKVSGATCKVEVTPLNDATVVSDLPCSHPENVAVVTSAFYTGTDSIVGSLSAFSGTSASGNILTVKPDGMGALTMSFGMATRNPTEILALYSCAGTIDATGGVIAGDEGGDCPSGSYTDATEGCIPCPTGSYCADGTATAASTCIAGTANPLLGTLADTSCVDCVAGTYSEAESSECLDCPLGTYQDLDAQSSCKTCLSAATTASTTCEGDTCTDPGQYFNPTTLVCEVCGDGYEVVDGECSPCAAGFSALAADATCAACDAGTYAPTEGTSECLTCSRGTQAGSSGEIGEAETTAATECTGCVGGTTSTAGGVCVRCPSGYYREGVGSSTNHKCVKCPSGKYTNAERTTCTSCPAGTYSTWNGLVRYPSNAEKCQPCAMGEYAPLERSSKCRSCKGGVYTARNTAQDTDNASILNVPTSSTRHGATSCSAPCASGFFRPSDASPEEGCQRCPAGYETSASSRATSCTPCSAGQYAATSGTVTCLDCAENYYNDKEGQTKCRICPKGSDTDGENGTEACSPCAPGSYNPTAGQTCKECEAGTTCAEGAQSQSSCPAGHYSAANNDECSRCSAGEYSSAGSGSCQSCSPGYSTKNKAGSTSCSPCPKGSAASGEGSASCKLCAPGFYNNSTGASGCTRCPRGSRCPTPGMAAAAACPPGSYTSQPGSKKCTKCRVNTYASSAGSTKCTRCPSGQWTNKKTGARTCVVRSFRRGQ